MLSLRVRRWSSSTPGARRLAAGLAATGLAALVGCGGADLGASSAALVTTCVNTPAEVPAGAWTCGSRAEVECTGAAVAAPELFFVEPICREVIADQDGPFTLGEHVIRLSVPASGLGGTVAGAPICEARLAVVDRTAPVVADRGSELWPPNHKLMTVRPGDCATVTDRCDPSVHLAFTYVASNEPDDALGDGSTRGDVVALGCDSVQLRAERAGPGDGRRYTLGVRATDEAGNVTDGVCTVVVPHDQSGRRRPSGGEAYRVDVAAACARPAPSGGHTPFNP